jgi:hypothetical protein
LVVAVLLAVASAALLGGALAAEPGAERAVDPAAAAPAAAASAAEPMTDWVGLLARLDTDRSRAFSAGSVAGLRAVYSDESAPLRADTLLLQHYTDRGLRVDGLRMEVRDLRLMEYDSVEAVLRVRDRIGSGRVVGARGREFALPPDAWTTHRITLRLTPAGWRISAIT